jgi:DNA-binding response OmpR family regulator
MVKGVIIMLNILVVDDDIYIRELVATILKKEFYTIIEATDGEEALNKIAEIKIDLCIVDVMMPKIDGFELCETLREYYKDMPILMLTAKNSIVDKVKAFDKGTDDYLTKPFANDELVVRVKALLRRYKREQEQILKIGTITIDRINHTISIDGSLVDIPLKEYKLLELLANEKNKTISRDRLIEDIWGYDFDGNERTLDVHINRLRDKFKDHLTITTIRGLGYRLEDYKNEES